MTSVAGEVFFPPSQDRMRTECTSLPDDPDLTSPVTVPAIYLTLGHAASTSRRRIASKPTLVMLGATGKVVEVYLCRGTVKGTPDQCNFGS